MPRIRTIKPSFWGSPEVAGMSRDARLLTIGLMSIADDDGRFLASPVAILGAIYPNDEDLTAAKVRRWVEEVVDVGMVHLYRSEGVQYGVLPSWHKHQKINRYTGSVLPEPDIECHPRSAGGSSDE